MVGCLRVWDELHRWGLWEQRSEQAFCRAVPQEEGWWRSWRRTL